MSKKKKDDVVPENEEITKEANAPNADEVKGSDENASNAKVEDEKADKVDPLEEANKKIAELENKYVRLYAEFDNFKKRSMREKDQRYADAVVDTVQELLQVHDNIERALKTEVTSEDAKVLYDGVSMVDKQMQDCLKKLDIKEIKAVGEQFDPNLHNAVMHFEDESIDDNTITEEFLKGYTYKDSRVVRYSMVKVAN